MTTIEQIIVNSPNPFDENYFKAGNFWLENPQEAQLVDSIHKSEFDKIESHLDIIIQDHYSRSLLLLGDSGAGKTHLLGRLKQQLNSKAFFVYVEPWADSKYIWRHILRRTVDSLLEKPEGKEDSQLILWLKTLSAFKTLDFRKWILGERKLFINKFQGNYPSGIYNAREFFGVLYDLTNPELYPIACDYLRGDSLPEDDLKQIRVRRSINNEDAAKNILGNFGRIASDTYPIMLCFDQLDNIPVAANGFINLQSLFNVNTTIHTQYFHNFLMLITMPTSTWESNKQYVQPADLALGRIHDTIRLKLINKEQIKALWALRLYSLHSQATPRPKSPIYPLNDEQIQIRFPGSKTLPRTVLVVGRELFQQYKYSLAKTIPSPKEDLLAAFKVRWQEEFKICSEKIKHIQIVNLSKFPQMLQQALELLGFKNIKLQILKEDVYNITYLNNNKINAVIYTENPSMNRFFQIMNSCKNAVNKKTFNHLYLIRNAPVGNPDLRGYQIYKQIFHPPNPNYRHLKYTLSSIHYLAAYDKLINAAKAKDLIIAGKEISLEKLQELMRQSEIFNQCQLLQELGVVNSNIKAKT